MKSMWEIFVPTVSNSGKPYRTRFHRVWDKKVQSITGGLTIYPPVRSMVYRDIEEKVEWEDGYDF